MLPCWQLYPCWGVYWQQWISSAQTTGNDNYPKQTNAGMQEKHGVSYQANWHQMLTFMGKLRSANRLCQYSTPAVKNVFEHRGEHTLQKCEKCYKSRNVKDSCSLHRQQNNHRGRERTLLHLFSVQQYVSGEMATQWNVPTVHNLTFLPAKKHTHYFIFKFKESHSVRIHLLSLYCRIKGRCVIFADGRSQFAERQPCVGGWVGRGMTIGFREEAMWTDGPWLPPKIPLRKMAELTYFWTHHAVQIDSTER